jgi:hypothetical protein
LLARAEDEFDLFISGIRRVALLGSITTNKQNPKDIDFLVEWMTM